MPDNSEESDRCMSSKVRSIQRCLVQYYRYRLIGRRESFKPDKKLKENKKNNDALSENLRG